MAENTPIINDEPVTPTTLSDYPTMFNTTEIPFFYGTETYEKVQTTSLSESGKDLVQIVRTSKLSISCSFNIADVEWVQTFRQFSLLPSFTLKLYDPLTDDYAEHTVRMEDYSHTRVRFSDRLEAVKGVWNVSFTIREF